jgi:hypothetical protein
MSTPRCALSLIGLATAVALTGCSCGPDTHAVNAFPTGQDVLTVVRDGVTRHVDAAGQVNEFIGAPENFQFVYNTIEGSTRGDGIRIGVGGDDPVTNEGVMLVFALPVSLRQGDVYTVGRTFAVEPSVDFPDPLAVWGPHDLQESNRAEVGFTTSTYTFPPAHFMIGYRATSATGTIQVTKREHGRAELNLNLSFVDAAGKTALVTGHVTVATQQTPAPCN